MPMLNLPACALWVLPHRLHRLQIRVFAGLLILLVAALPLRAEAPVKGPVEAPVGVSQFTLNNGLEVVVIEDHRTPIVTHMLWYRVGSADEMQGETGLAHFFEHLMFKGTDKIAPGDFSKIVAANGGEDNAFTSYDYTAYYQRIAADRLGLVMEMEADRMVHLSLSEDIVATERDVVIEERKSRTDSDVHARFREQLRALSWQNHPYRLPVIGWMHEIEALSRENALAFYGKYYAPNNAILVVAGDVTLEEVRTLAQQYYGPLLPSDAIEPTRKRPAEPPRLGERRLIMRDADVRQPYLVHSYAAPARKAGAQDEAAALTLFASYLGSGDINGILARELQLEQKIALSVGAGYRGLALDESSFSLYILPMPEVTLADAEQALAAQLSSVLDAPVDMDRFEMLKTAVAADEIYVLDNQFARARLYGMALTSGLTLDDIHDWRGALLAVTPEAMIEAGRALLATPPVTGWLMAPEGS